MANSKIGTYHLADNPELYEIQRNNTFEFVVTDIDNLLRAGAIGTEANARITNGQEVLRMSVTKAQVPHFTQEVVAVKRGNTTLKYAGVPSFNEGSFSFNDFIGADTKSVLMAWQALSCDIENEKVGALDKTNYKKRAYLIEYTPDYRKVRTWVLYGCWISSLSEGEYSSEDGGKHQIDCTIQYDRAAIDLSDSM